MSEVPGGLGAEQPRSSLDCAAIQECVGIPTDGGARDIDDDVWEAIKLKIVSDPDLGAQEIDWGSEAAQVGVLSVLRDRCPDARNVLQGCAPVDPPRPPPPDPIDDPVRVTVWFKFISWVRDGRHGVDCTAWQDMPDGDEDLKFGVWPHGNVSGTKYVPAPRVKDQTVELISYAGSCPHVEGYHVVYHQVRKAGNGFHFKVKNCVGEVFKDYTYVRNPPKPV